jgi:hypothetical protein
MKQLQVEPIEHIIRTLLIEVFITEMEKLKVVVETLTNPNPLTYGSIAINFNVVAEIKYVHAEYFEMEDFEILNETENDTHFYEVQNSAWLKASKTKYDLLNRLNLKHYLIVGQYSYIEVLSKNYIVEKIK